MVFNTHVRTTTTTRYIHIYSIQFAPFCSFIRFILAIKFINEICLFALFYCGKVVWSGDGNLNAALWYILCALAFRDSKQCWIDFICSHTISHSLSFHAHLSYPQRFFLRVGWPIIWTKSLHGLKTKLYW